MTVFDRINRRTHLYLGLFLIPWVFIYGFSSFVMNHRYWFIPKKEIPWQTLFERDYAHPVPETGDLRPSAADILKENHLDGAFFVQRPGPQELRITRSGFFSVTRLTYNLQEHRLKAERQPSPWDAAVIRMHVKGGYNQPRFVDDFWAVLVDLTCIAILIWIVSGIIMWWRLVHLRRWGLVTLMGGILCFAWLMWKL